MKEIANYKFFEIGSFYLTGASLLGAFLAIFITYLLLLIIRRSLLSSLNLTAHDRGRRTSIYTLIKYLLWIFAFIACIRIFGFDIGILMAGSAAFLIGLGFGLQGVFYDLISGIIMLVERNIRVGDILELKDKVGKVKEISLRTSIILTRDEEEIIIPNHHFIAEDVINTSYDSFCRRFRINLSVNFNEDVEKVGKILIECALKFDLIIQDEERYPIVRLTDFGEQALQMELLYYSKEVFRIGSLKSQLRMAILKRFREEKIQFPFPTFNLKYNKDVNETNRKAE